MDCRYSLLRRRKSRHRSTFSWFYLCPSFHLAKMCCVLLICYVSDTGDISLPKVDLPSESSRLEGQEDRKKEHKEYHRKEPLPQAQA